MIVVDTDVLIEIFEKRSAKGDEALKRTVSYTHLTLPTIYSV